MRIISKQKDYYDCMQPYYQDDLVYIRKPIVLEHLYRSRHTEERNYNNRMYCWRMYKGNNILEGWYRVPKVTIGFCGKYYWSYKILPPEKSKDYESKIVWGYSDIDKYYPSNIATAMKNYFKPTNRNDYEDIFCSQDYKHEEFVKYKSPICVHYTNKIVWNDTIGNHGFAKIFPPQQAYQEIMMYFGSQLAQPEKPIPEIDDVTMAEAKGFDKYSFRKPKSKC